MVFLSGDWVLGTELLGVWGAAGYEVIKKVLPHVVQAGGSVH